MGRPCKNWEENMFVRLSTTSITADQTSDSQDGPVGRGGLLDHTDEDYFLVAGASVDEGAISFRVTPQHSDHFDISDHQTLNNIFLWEGFVGDMSGAFLNIAVRDRKNALWDAVLHIAEVGGLVGAAILLEDPSIGQQALVALEQGAKDFAANLKGDNDKTLGLVSVRLLAQGAGVQPTWQVQADTTFLLSGPNETPANFSLTGANCKYRMQIGVEARNLPTLGSTCMAGSGDHLYVIRGAYLVRADLNGHGEVLLDQNGNKKAWGGSTCMAAWGDHLYIIQGPYLVRADLNGHWEALPDQNGNNHAWGGSSCMAAWGDHLYIIQGPYLVRADLNGSLGRSRRSER
jgi:hypothetical protein